MIFLDPEISDSTKRNWQRLNTNPAGRLTTRANKRNSDKHILPLEYFSSSKNIPFVEDIILTAQKSNYRIESVLLSFAINLLKKANILEKPNVKDVLSEYSHNIPVIPEFMDMLIPDDEFDLLGLIYQSLLPEGEKNIRGSYYTPQSITQKMIADFDFSNNQTFLDPCCGSGAFLMEIPVTDPSQLFGIDNDDIAVMIARVNLLLRFKSVNFIPQIYRMDFLDLSAYNKNLNISTKKFDYIATNPPWGGMRSNQSQNNLPKETFSSVFVASYYKLNDHGIIRFLFPEAILNIKAHYDIRHFILQNTGLRQITVYEDMFSGVTTRFVDIECDTDSKLNYFVFNSCESSRQISKKAIYESDNLAFNPLDERDLTILQAVRHRGRFSLKSSTWALGIVTGDNKKKLFSEPRHGTEPIYTGKDVLPFRLAPATKYIVYDRDNLQQVAKEEFYRAPEKLVYKFISNKLVFAYDNNQRLFLNSANILIPNIPDMSIKAVLAFLNSSLFQFVYTKLFRDAKVLKGNLAQLPFPEISYEENQKLIEFTDKILRGDNFAYEALDKFIFAIYDLSESQIKYIRGTLNGTSYS